MTDAFRVPWRNPRIVATVILVFLAGALAGALTMRWHLHGVARRASTDWKEGLKEISLQKLKKDLNLSAEQAQQMETVLDDFVMYYQTLQAQMDEVRASGKERILRILNPEQKKKFEKMLSDVQARQAR